MSASFAPESMSHIPTRSQSAAPYETTKLVFKGQFQQNLDPAAKKASAPARDTMDAARQPWVFEHDGKDFIEMPDTNNSNVWDLTNDCADASYIAKLLTTVGVTEERPEEGLHNKCTVFGHYNHVYKVFHKLSCNRLLPLYFSHLRGQAAHTVNLRCRLLPEPKKPKTFLKR